MGEKNWKKDLLLLFKFLGVLALFVGGLGGGTALYVAYLVSKDPIKRDFKLYRTLINGVPILYGTTDECFGLEYKKYIKNKCDKKFKFRFLNVMNINAADVHSIMRSQFLYIGNTKHKSNFPQFCRNITPELFVKLDCINKGTLHINFEARPFLILDPDLFRPKFYPNNSSSSG